MSPWRRLAADDDGEAAAAAAAEALGRGEVLAHPTETVYGLGAGTAAGDDRVRALKGRGEEVPLLRLAHDVATLREVHPELRWSGEAEALAEAFWPGPLTLVLDDGGPRGLGVRVEGHPATRAVLAAWGRTMSSTSLNRSGEPPAASASAARRELERLTAGDGATVRWLDAGDLPGGPPSTLVSLRGERPRLLRSGAIDPDRIQDVMGGELDRG